MKDIWIRKISQERFLRVWEPEHDERDPYAYNCGGEFFIFVYSTHVLIELN